MARSYKKKPIIKDVDKDFKKLGNRKMRSKSKQLTKLIKCIGKNCAHCKCDYEDPLLFPQDKSEVVNDYDVTDWKTIDAHKYVNKRKTRGKKLNK